MHFESAYVALAKQEVLPELRPDVSRSRSRVGWLADRWQNHRPKIDIGQALSMLLPGLVGQLNLKTKSHKPLNPHPIRQWNYSPIRHHQKYFARANGRLEKAWI